MNVVDDGWYQDELPDSVATTVEPDRAKSIITTNDSPDIPFDYSINPYRGCEHGCVYCLAGDTSILVADGSCKALSDLEIGEEIYGTAKRGHYRRYVRTRVLAHWRTRKAAYRVRLADGTELVASANHRLLTERGWKFVGRAGREQRPSLTLNNKLMGFGALTAMARRCSTRDYRRGYLCGLIRGDGHLKSYHYERAGRANGDQHRFRLAMADDDALERATTFLAGFGISTDRFLFQPQGANRRRMDAIRTSALTSVEAIGRLIEWPHIYEGDWAYGFLAGIFDAEGSYSSGTIRIANTDWRMIQVTRSCLMQLGFDSIVETTKAGTARPVHYVRVRGGLREHLRLFRSCDPSITRKRSIEQQAVKSRADLAVVDIELLGGEQDLFDITTGTGDFIANGVISHNCYARPSHSYMGLSAGLDFETKLFYKADAANLLERELARPGYVCKPITIGANTDPYQPLEKKLEVTRSILTVLARCRHPVSIVTKGALIARDIDLLTDMARDNLAWVAVSLTTLTAETKRTLEPRAASPEARLRVMRQLSDAGVPVCVMVAPVIPAITDHEFEQLLEAARAAGAKTAGYVLLRLPYEVKTLFREWLAEHYPDRAEHVMSLVNEMRGGRDNDPNFGSRMRGTGPFADLLRKRFQMACRRLDLNGARDVRLTTAHFRPPTPKGGQLGLVF
ncbi:MAG: PA0069 family radical SAM protein [Steroidobacteraceae bacterium]